MVNLHSGAHLMVLGHLLITLKILISGASTALMTSGSTITIVIELLDVDKPPHINQVSIKPLESLLPPPMWTSSKGDFGG